jgi:hypothetical protein
LRVKLDSPGGDVDAALQIGRIIRKHEGITHIEVDRQCYSSCALLFIAGVSRLNFGLIGLHRPYLASTPQSRESIERKIPLMLQKLKAYVQEMGITDRFYQEMVNTDPSGMKVYNSANIEDIVSHIDPTFDEIYTAFNARKYGIDTAQMRLREKAANRCPDSDYFYCQQAIYYGIDQRLAKSRWELTPKCIFTPQEAKQLSLVTLAERRDHPLMLKSETCYRNVMMGR